MNEPLYIVTRCGTAWVGSELWLPQHARGSLSHLPCIARVHSIWHETTIDKLVMVVLGHGCLDVIGWKAPTTIPICNRIPLLLLLLLLLLLWLVDHVLLLDALVWLMGLGTSNLIQDVSVDVRRGMHRLSLRSHLLLLLLQLQRKRRLLLRL